MPLRFWLRSCYNKLRPILWTGTTTQSLPARLSFTASTSGIASSINDISYVVLSSAWSTSPWLPLHAGGEDGEMESWYRGVTDLPGPGSILPGHIIININISLVFHGMSQSVVMWSREQPGSSTLMSSRWHPCTMRRWQVVNNRYLNLSFWVNSERCSLTAGRHNAITAAELNAMLVENSTAVSSSTRQDVSTNKLLVLKQILHYLIYNMIWEDKVGVFKVGD